jgi:hypothetical protein
VCKRLYTTAGTFLRAFLQMVGQEWWISELGGIGVRLLEIEVKNLGKSAYFHLPIRVWLVGRLVGSMALTCNSLEEEIYLSKYTSCICICMYCMDVSR